MTFLAPAALLWLITVPVFLWLWRLAASHRQTAIPSLIPFERLLQRPPKRRTSLVTNMLFWLQLFALLGLILALAQPVLTQPRARVVLAVLDTSASMGATGHGAPPFEQARRALLKRIAKKSPTEQLLIMTTSPVAALTAQPTSDAIALARAVDAVQVQALGGNLSATARIGRALLGSAPDETLLFTDEPRPTEPLGPGVRMVSVGALIPNVGIVGVEAHGSLCTPTDSRIIVTVQNFSNNEAAATLSATHGSQRFTEVRATLAAHARSAFAVALPEGTEGMIDLALTAAPDGLAVDNHAWVDLHRRASVPVMLNVQTPTIRQAITSWLNACQALTWSEATPPGSHVMITDREALLASTHVPTLVFLPPVPPVVVRGYWTAETDHVIGAYLNPLEVVAAPLNTAPGAATTGLPVVSGFVNGRKVPIVVADEREGRRVVSMLLDPSDSDESTPVLLVFLNSLRWLMGDTAHAVTGEPIIVNGLPAGAIQVRTPHGSIETVEAEGTALRYDHATSAGLYRFSRGTTAATVAVNFLNPLESNLLERTTTWQPMETSVAPGSTGRTAFHPLANMLLIFILVVLLIEWWRYSLKGTWPSRRPEFSSPMDEGGALKAATAPREIPTIQPPVMR